MHRALAVFVYLAQAMSVAAGLDFSEQCQTVDDQLAALNDECDTLSDRLSTSSDGCSIIDDRLAKLFDELHGPCPVPVCTCPGVHGTDCHDDGFLCKDYPSRIPCANDYRCELRTKFDALRRLRAACVSSVESKKKEHTSCVGRVDELRRQYSSCMHRAERLDQLQEEQGRREQRMERLREDRDRLARRAERLRDLADASIAGLQTAIDTGLPRPAPGAGMVEGGGTFAATYPRILKAALKRHVQIAELDSDWSVVDKFWGKVQVLRFEAGNHDLDGDGVADAYYDSEQNRWRAPR